MWVLNHRLGEGCTYKGEAVLNHSLFNVQRDLLPIKANWAFQHVFFSLYAIDDNPNTRKS